VVPSDEVAVCNVSAEAMTLTCSLCAPTSSLRSRAGVSVTFKVTADTSDVLNPFAAKRTLYVPGGSSVKRYAPSALVVAVRTWLVSELVRVTVTLGTVAPEGSVTIPVRPAVPADCARRPGAKTTPRTANNITARRVQGSNLESITFLLFLDPKTRWVK
jgi:hypothetical protein